MKTLKIKTVMTILLIVTLSAMVGCCRRSKPAVVSASVYSSPQPYGTTGMYNTTPTDTYATSVEPQGQADFVGPRGPEGPAGARGLQGATGQTGLAGYAAAGPRGAQGPAGAMGQQGYAGDQGSAGNLAVGPRGLAGSAGIAGSRGGIGQTGARGISADGYAGLTGPAGPAGDRGPTGDLGNKGPTLTGPTGPVGVAGPAGEQGERGWVGVQGTTTAGVAGAVGPVGPQGDPGLTGPTGPQGPAGVVTRWTSYRDFWFESGKTVLNSSDSDKLAEIAAYMKANPSIQLGIDGSTNPRATAEYTLNLCDNRVKAVRDALITAGVPATRISDGMFGDVNLRRTGRVEVLIKTK